MDENRAPRWVATLGSIFGLALGIYGLWCTVVAFRGGTIPLTGIRVHGNVLLALAILFVGEPLLFWLGSSLAALVLAPILLATQRKT